MKVLGRECSAGFVITVVVVVLLWVSILIPNLLPARSTAAKQWQPGPAETNR